MWEESGGGEGGERRRKEVMREVGVEGWGVEGRPVVEEAGVGGG